VPDAAGELPLLELLAATNGQPKAEQNKTYQQMHLKSPQAFK